MSFYNDISAELKALNEAGSLRKLRVINTQEAKANVDSQCLWNFSGNDYLGIAGDDELRAQFYATLQDAKLPKWQLSAASSRLLTGNSEEYYKLEETLKEWYGQGCEALVFNSGYHANIGILAAISKKDDLILSDKLNHASIIDGMKLCEAQFRRYRHFDYNQLEDMLKVAAKSNRRVFIVSESIFSMDGDEAKLNILVELKNRYGAILVIDEAHSVGVYGDGRGYCVSQGVAEHVDVLIGTFGKAFGSAGAYAIVKPVLRDYLINKMRTLIFTTGLPPVSLAWSRFVINRMKMFKGRRERLMEISEKLRQIIYSKGYKTGGTSQIVPLHVGNNFDAINLANRLNEGGILCFAIRPPTVPIGSSRLRFSLNAALPDKALLDLEELL